MGATTRSNDAPLSHSFSFGHWTDPPCLLYPVRLAKSAPDRAAGGGGGGDCATHEVRKSPPAVAAARGPPDMMSASEEGGGHGKADIARELT